MPRGQITPEGELTDLCKAVNKVKDPEHRMLWLLSDEKNFDHHQNVNRRHDRCLYIKFPTTVMVFGVVKGKSHIILLHFFFNDVSYTEMLETWIENVR